MHGKQKLLDMCNELGVEMEENPTCNDMVAVLTEMGTKREDLLRKPGPETMIVQEDDQVAGEKRGKGSAKRQPKGAPEVNIAKRAKTLFEIAETLKGLMESEYEEDGDNIEFGVKSLPQKQFAAAPHVPREQMHQRVWQKQQQQQQQEKRKGETQRRNATTYASI